MNRGPERDFHAAASDLFLRALERSPDDPESFARAEAADRPPLLAEVLSLLASRRTEGPAGLTERIAGEMAAAVAATAREAPFPDVGDDYRVLRLVDRGGMGEVYEADQLRPFRRRVAIKIVRADLESARVLRRFESEQQVLAALNHPGIARAYDAGVTRDGRPYFVMEFVDGRPITEFCDERRLGLRERLELIRAAAEAVHHAHQRGVLHRDLKPSNLLASEEGGRVSVKVIDFGIAKALGPEFEFGQTATMAGVVMGTPEYMSPEQATTLDGTAGVAADIYSLGAVLYELLTGTVPMPVPRDTPMNPVKLARLFEAFEPVRPSLRLRRPGAGLPGGRPDEIAWRRGLDAAGLERALRSDLDWIALKALDRDPERRYLTAREFAAEIGHFLAGEPVLARSPHPVDRARVWVRRRPAVAASLAVAALSILLGMTAAAWQWREAARQRDIARQQVERLQDLSATLVRELAELREIPGSTGAREALARLASENLAAMDARVEENPDALFLLAESYEALGHLQGDVGGASIGRSDLAFANIRRSCEILASLHAHYPANTAYAVELAANSISLGSMLQSFGRTDEGRRVMTGALALADSLDRAGSLPPGRRILVGDILSLLAWESTCLGEMERAREFEDRGLTLLESIPAGAVRRDSLVFALASAWGQVSEETADLARAEHAAEQCLAHAREGMRLAPFSHQSQMVLSMAHRNLGDVRRMQGRPAEALPHYRECAALRQRLVDADGKDLRARHLLGYAWARIGSAWFEAGRPDSAEAWLRRALAAQETLVRMPNGPSWAAWELGFTQVALARLVAADGRIDEARRLFGSALPTRGADATSVEAMKFFNRWRLEEEWGHVEERWGSRATATDLHRRAAMDLRETARRLAMRDEPCLPAWQDVVAGLLHAGRFVAGDPAGRPLADSLLAEALLAARARLPGDNPARRAAEAAATRTEAPAGRRYALPPEAENRRFADLAWRNIPHDPLWGVVPVAVPAP